MLANTKQKESVKPSSGKPELRHRQQSFLSQTSLVLSTTGSVELRLVSSAITEHTNNNTSRIYYDWSLSVKTDKFKFQDSASKLSWFWRRIYLSVFTIYGHGGNIVQWRRTIRTNCQYLFNRKPNVLKIAQTVSEEKRGQILHAVGLFIQAV